VAGTRPRLNKNGRRGPSSSLGIIAVARWRRLIPQPKDVLRRRGPGRRSRRVRQTPQAAGWECREGAPVEAEPRQEVRQDPTTAARGSRARGRRRRERGSSAGRPRLSAVASASLNEGEGVGVGSAPAAHRGSDGAERRGCGLPAFASPSRAPRLRHPTHSTAPTASRSRTQERSAPALLSRRGGDARVDATKSINPPLPLGGSGR